jgi:hypothetical protein
MTAAFTSQAEKGSTNGANGLTASVFVWLAEYIDGFSLMTYDYSSPQRYV